MAKKGKATKASKTEQYQAREGGVEKVITTHDKYEQTYYKIPDMLNGVQVKD